MEENENNSMRSHEVQNSQDTSEQNNNNDDMEESDDQSQEEETNKFLNLISKAERKNQRKMDRQLRHQQGRGSQSWRDVHLSDPDDDTEDTDDEDDPNETKKFLSMFKGKPKKNLVNIRWVNGKVEVTPVSEDAGVSAQPEAGAGSFPDTLTVTRMEGGPGSQPRPRPSLPDTVTITRIPAVNPAPAVNPQLPCFNPVPAGAAAAQPLDCVRQHREEVARQRPREKPREAAAAPEARGKRKFEDRMTLTEAKMDDFQDSRDYVDFLQSKLQGINIKIVK